MLRTRALQVSLGMEAVALLAALSSPQAVSGAGPVSVPKLSVAAPQATPIAVPKLSVAAPQATPIAVPKLSAAAPQATPIAVPKFHVIPAPTPSV